MSNLATFTAGNSNPISGVFGNGNVLFFTSSRVWTTPAGVTSVRARVWGGGGGNNASRTGGSGGGFSMLTSTVTPSTNYTVTVGGINGTSSFAAFNSATGGQAQGGTRGYGVGGIISTGGYGGSAWSHPTGPQSMAGGGGVGSLLGDGGDGGYTWWVAGESKASGGGGAGYYWGGGSSGGGGFTSVGGSNGHYSNFGATGIVGGQALPVTPFQEFALDFIGTGGGGGGGGAGGGAGTSTGTGGGGNGFNGGGGGGGGGAGGFPGGGGGGLYAGTEATSDHARPGLGLVILEW